MELRQLEHFVAVAHAVMDAVQGARDVVDEFGAGMRGSVRVGLLPGLGLVDLPAAAGEFRRRYQNVELQLRVEPDGSAGVIVGPRNGDIDVGGPAGVARAGWQASPATGWDHARRGPDGSTD